MISNKGHSPTIKKDVQHESLQEQGFSKEKQAKINSPSKRSEEVNYENLAKDELHKIAAKAGIENAPKMTKEELIKALRLQ